MQRMSRIRLGGEKPCLITNDRRNCFYGVFLGTGRRLCGITPCHYDDSTRFEDNCSTHLPIDVAIENIRQKNRIVRHVNITIDRAGTKEIAVCHIVSF